MLEIIKLSVPALISAFVAWNIATYNNKNNIPLDKYIIAYNRVYYPMYCHIESSDCKNVKLEELMSLFDDKLKKYKKYIAPSTVKTYKLFIQKYNNDEFDKRKSYELLRKNIIEYNYKLRKRLGYVEDDFFVAIKYMSSETKKWLTLGIVYCLFGVFVFLNSIYDSDILLIGLGILLLVASILAFAIVINFVNEEIYNITNKIRIKLNKTLLFFKRNKGEK